MPPLTWDDAEGIALAEKYPEVMGIPAKLATIPG